EARARPLRLGDGAGEVLAEKARVGQSRELVVGGHARDRLFHLLALRDVASDAAVALEDVLRVEDRIAVHQRRVRDEALRVAPHDLELAEGLVGLEDAEMLLRKSRGEIAIRRIPPRPAEGLGRIDPEVPEEAA